MGPFLFLEEEHARRMSVTIDNERPTAILLRLTATRTQSTFLGWELLLLLPLTLLQPLLRSFVRSLVRFCSLALTCTIYVLPNPHTYTCACFAWGTADIPKRFVALPFSSSASPHSDELRYLCAFAGSGFTDQHERLIVLETVQNLVTVLAYR